MAHRRHSSRSNVILHSKPHKRKTSQNSKRSESYEEKKKEKKEAQQERTRQRDVLNSRLQRCLRMAEREVESVEDAEMLSETEKYLQLKVLILSLFKVMSYDHRDTIVQTGKTLLGQFKEAEAARGLVARGEIKDFVGQWHLGCIGTHDCVSSVAHPFCLIDELKGHARRVLVKDLPELESDLILKMVVAASVAFRSKQRRECDSCLEGKHSYSTLSYEKAITKVKNDLLREFIYTPVSTLEVETKFGESMVELTGFVALYLSFANVYNAPDIQNLVVSLPLVLENYALWRKKPSWMKACTELIEDLDVFRYRKAMRDETTSAEDSDSSLLEVPIPRLRQKTTKPPSPPSIPRVRLKTTKPPAPPSVQSNQKGPGMSYSKAHDLVKECGIWSDHSNKEIKAKLDSCPRSFKKLSQLDPQNNLWKDFLVGRVIKIARDMISGRQDPDMQKKEVEAEAKKITYGEYYKLRSKGGKSSPLKPKPVLSSVRKSTSIARLKRKAQFSTPSSKKQKPSSKIPPLERIN